MSELESRKIVEINKDDNTFIFECPQCELQIQVQIDQVNCQIFRHAVYKNSFQQVNPHLPKSECDKLIEQDLVIGCCKPFKFYKSNPPYVETCEYI